MGTGAFVLVADDDPGNRVLTTRQLEILGCEVKAVADGAEAVDTVRAEPPLLVLMDRNMPGIDGLEATRAIRQLPGAESIPIVGLTADVTPAAQEAFRAAGANDVIHRPVLLEDLRAVVERWVVSPPPPGPATTAAIEERDEVLARLRADVGEETAQRIVSIYLEHMDERIAAIRAAIVAEDAGALGGAAHAMRSATTVFDYDEVSNVCGKLESLGNSGTTAGSTELLDELERAAGGLRRLLDHPDRPQESEPPLDSTIR